MASPQSRHQPRVPSTLLFLSALVLINTLLFSSLSSTGTVSALPVIQPRRIPLAIAILGAGHRPGVAIDVGDHGPIFSLRHPTLHHRSDNEPVAQEKGEVSIRSESEETERISKRTLEAESAGPSEPAVGANADGHDPRYSDDSTAPGQHEMRPLPIEPKGTSHQGEKSLLRRRKADTQAYRPGGPGSGGQYDKGKPYGR
ncbi:hypothetical protein BGW38_000881 [Lunasporangiospora selenospora]|uniref:Transmembrane protein n=1 Tax=Lunasporangiospora selenospora TaxID=979761 RepID=A0A9P6G1H8_9FUNG|nr:hypothetical protein BGW38_000881 [Lunasporangiospora selenospora]